MAHLIDQTTGKAAIFVTGEPAWHRLGVVVQQAQTSAEAIRLAGLDWQVEKRNLAAAVPGGGWSPVAGHYATVRTDTNATLGVVGEQYRPFQNADAFDFMDSLVGDKLAMFETAGAIKEGRRVWVMARIPTEYRIAGQDTIKPYVLLTNSHDGTSTIRMIPTTVRVVCNNTLSLALRRAGVAEGLAITHTESVTRRVEEARNKLGVIVKRLDEFAVQATTMARRQMSKSELSDYFSGLVEARSEKQQQKLLEKFLDNFENARNALPGIRGSVWAAYNAVSEYADHQMTVHGQDQFTKDNNRLNSIWFGSANNLKQQALEAALALAV